MTMGIWFVACRAASIPIVPDAMMMSLLTRTSSVASAGRRSVWPFA